MPDPGEIIRGIRRYKWAAGQKKGIPRLPKFVVAGFGKTRKTRETLARRYRTRIAELSGPEAAKDFDDVDLLRMAYGQVWGAGDDANGIGRVANVLRGSTSKFWNAFHAVFSVAQLAGRPVAWAFRVLLEEQVRADLMGLPSLFRNPVGYLDASFDAHIARSLPKWMKRDAEALDLAITDMLSGSADDIERAVRDRMGDKAANQILTKLNVADFAELNKDGLRKARTMIAQDLWRGLAQRSDLAGRVIGSRGNWARRAFNRTRYHEGTQRVNRLAKRGLTSKFDFAKDGEGIIGRSLASEFIKEAESAVQRMVWEPGMKPAMVRAYGYGLGRRLKHDMSDPIVMRFGMVRAAQAGVDGRVPIGAAAEDLAVSASWLKIRDGMADSYRFEKGIEPANELALTRWYLDEIVDPYIESTFGWMWRNPDGTVNPVEKARVAALLSEGNAAKIRINDIEFTVDKSQAYTTFTRNMQDIAEEAYRMDRGLGPVMPAKFAAHFDPQYALPVTGVRHIRRMADKLMHIFGEQASQRLNRQPAFIKAHGQWFNRFKNLGLDDDAARAMANEKATEIVNYVFYNTKNQTRFLRQMNKISPFFTAWWEVMQTWAYKIPTQNVAGLGHIALARKVDRFMKGLVKTGIVEQGEPGVGGERQWFLNLREPTGEELNTFGAALSQVGQRIVRAPVTVLEHAANLGRQAVMPLSFKEGKIRYDFSEYKPIDLSDWGKDEYSIAIGSPINPLTHGVMGVNQLFFGFNPIIQAAYTKFKGALPFASDEERVQFAAGTTIADIVDRMPENVEWPDLLHANRQELKQAFDPETFARLLDGSIQLNDLLAALPEDTFLTVPKSSIWEVMADNFFQPFGEITLDAPGGIQAITPSALTYIWRGLGVYPGDQALGVEGLLTAPYDTPQGRIQIGSELAGAIAHIFATEGIAQQVNPKLARIAEIEDNLAGDLAFDPSMLTPGSDATTEYHDLTREVRQIEERVLQRAHNIAGGNLILRGFMGWFGAGTPRLAWEEQRITQDFWQSKEFAENMKERGFDMASETFTGSVPRSFEEITRLYSLVDQWLTDDTGSQAKAWLKETYPGMLPFIQGKTAWGPAGPPKEIDAFDEYFDQIREGARQPYPTTVQYQKQLRLDAVASFELDVGKLAGSMDPLDQAVWAQTTGYEAFSDLNDNLGHVYQGLEWLDEPGNGGSGEYAAWLGRNTDDTLSLLDKAREEARFIRSAIDDIEAAIDLAGMSERDEQRFLGMLKSIGGGIQDFISLYDERTTDERFDQPRDKLIIDHYAKQRELLYNERTRLYDLLSGAETRNQRKLVFEKVRQLENEYYRTPQEITWGDRSLPVWNDFDRRWYALQPEEKMNSYLRWLGGRPEWRNQFELTKLVEAAPQIAPYIPTTDAQFAIYDRYADLKQQVYDFGNRLGPDGRKQMTDTEMDLAVDELEKQFEVEMRRSGREKELIYHEAWPIERLLIAGMLPQSLVAVQQYVTGIKQELAAADKGPTSEMGETLFLGLKNYLETTLYKQRPDVKEAILILGEQMFNEGLLSEIYAKLFWAGFGFAPALE
jgi:hypothetical protein